MTVRQPTPKVPGSNPGPATKSIKGVTVQRRSPFQFFPTNRIIDLVKTLEDIKSTLSRHRKDMSENFRAREYEAAGGSLGRVS